MIAYHGTDPEIAKMILASGEFKKGTYFAFNIEDAIKFGGPHVFQVNFSDDAKHWKGEPDGWQFHLRNTYSTENIVNSAVAGCVWKFFTGRRTTSNVHWSLRAIAWAE